LSSHLPPLPCTLPSTAQPPSAAPTAANPFARKDSPPSAVCVSHAICLISRRSLRPQTTTLGCHCPSFPPPSSLHRCPSPSAAPPSVPGARVGPGSPLPVEGEGTEVRGLARAGTVSPPCCLTPLWEMRPLTRHFGPQHVSLRRAFSVLPACFAVCFRPMVTT